MKPITLFSIIFLSVFNSYAQNCAFSNGNTFNGENSDPIITNLTLLLYRSLPIYTVHKKDIFDSHRKIITKNKKPAISYNKFLNEADTRNLWTPLLEVAHKFGHSVAVHSNWFHHLLQPWDKDLKVDYLSGYIFGKLGASIQDCEETFKVTVNKFPLRNHYNNDRRLNAVIAGYFRAVYNF